MTKIDVTSSMIAEAMDIGTKTGLFAPNAKREDVIRLIQGVLSLVGSGVPEKFNCRVNLIRGQPDVRARIIGPSSVQRGYLDVETEDGKRRVVSGNELSPYSTYRPGR